jgi:hypothetical protein
MFMELSHLSDRSLGTDFCTISRGDEAHAVTESPVKSGLILRNEIIKLQSVTQISSPARMLGSCAPIPLAEWMIACVYSVFVLSCVGIGLATG